MRILILGGATEASALAALVAGEPGIEPVLSMAGRTSEPRPLPVPTRVGGFGGVDGLVRYLAENRVQAVVDSTHPFAAIMSRNAAEACARAGVPLLALRRAPWEPRPGDRWTWVRSSEEAAAALGSDPKIVFLTVGRLELPAFAVAPQHRYVVRTIEPVGDALPVPDLVTIRDRGPFDEAAERAIMAGREIEVLVTKNSGGSATYPKLAAARELGIPVIVVARPEKPAGVPEVAGAGEALAWLREVGRLG